ncbi:lysis system i-spanin subunit Rz [Pseudomonas aeruginosa]|nr:lysis system i-spanin subunit Rz [Pseudomonas aeruginosa]UQS71216.1 lysis protein [Pseudomonas aeruginosa]HBO4305534.1 lysis protein [Pseudomonas aeruginosa]HCF1768993.1 lysis protein [Pseudomonas aeruginosa]
MVIAALVLIFVVAATWRVAEWRFGEQIAALKLQHERERLEASQAVAAELQRRTGQRQRLEADLQAIDEQRFGELRHAQAINDQLTADLAAARQRLRVRITRASCSATGLPAGTVGAGVDDGAEYAELHPAIAADLARLAGDADQCAVKLSALQAREAMRKGRRGEEGEKKAERIARPPHSLNDLDH